MGQPTARPVPDHREELQHLLQIRQKRPPRVSRGLPDPINPRGRVREGAYQPGPQEGEDLPNLRCFQVGPLQISRIFPAQRRDPRQGRGLQDHAPPLEHRTRQDPHKELPLHQPALQKRGRQLQTQRPEVLRKLQGMVHKDQGQHPTDRRIVERDVDDLLGGEQDAETEGEAGESK